jgi:hypothetical protein
MHYLLSMRFSLRNPVARRINTTRQRPPRQPSTPAPYFGDAFTFTLNPNDQIDEVGAGDTISAADGTFDVITNFQVGTNTFDIRTPVVPDAFFNSPFNGSAQDFIIFDTNLPIYKNPDNTSTSLYQFFTGVLSSAGVFSFSDISDPGPDVALIYFDETDQAGKAVVFTDLNFGRTGNFGNSIV